MHHNTFIGPAVLSLAALVSAAPDTFGQVCNNLLPCTNVNFICVPTSRFCTNLSYCLGQCILSGLPVPLPLPISIPPISIPPISIPDIFTFPTPPRPTPTPLSTLTSSLSRSSGASRTTFTPSSPPTSDISEPTPVEPPTGDYASCGGFRPFPAPPCPQGTFCSDDPRRGPSCGMACDAPGICIPSDVEICGGYFALSCPEGLECFEDPNDECDPDNLGADCNGICLLPVQDVWELGDPPVFEIPELLPSPVDEILEPVESSVDEILGPIELPVDEIPELIPSAVDEIVEPIESSVDAILEPVESSVNEVLEPINFPLDEIFEPVTLSAEVLETIELPVEDLAETIGQGEETR